MKLFNFLWVLLVVASLVALGNVYLTNYDLLNRQLLLWGDQRIRIWVLVLAVLALGFILNLIWNGYVTIRDAVKGLNDSAASRLGRRLSERLQDARELLAHGLYAQSREILDGILEEQPEHTGARLMKGEVLLKMGDVDGALKHFEAQAKANPRVCEAKYQLAETLVANRNAESAIAILKQIAGDHPKQALKALRRLRALYTEAQRWEEALEIHKRLLNHFANEVGQAERSQGTALTYQVGLTKIDLDLFKEAALGFQQVIKEDPSFIPAYLSLGRTMILQDQEQPGLEIWMEGFRATGEGAFLQEIEDYFIQMGKPDEGLGLLRKVAATSRHPVIAKFFLGKMLYRLEILDEALEQFQEVRSQVVYSPVLFFFMAKIHSRRGRLDAALNEYRQLLRNLGVLKLRFECSVCNHKSLDYVDRCESCGSWNSVHFLFKENDLPDSIRPETGSGWLSMV